MTMRSIHPIFPHRGDRGFTILEVLVSAGILAVLMAALVPNLRRSWENERVLAVANEFATWLNKVRTSSMINDTACRVTIIPAGDDSGEVLATVRPVVVGTDCFPDRANLVTDEDFLIPAMPAGRFAITVSANAAPNNPFTYTPRGATTNTAAVTVTLATRGQPAVRCVQISPILAQVRVGAMVGGACMID
jgi:prepilin-type N-terminal cleavage/methylation domain-containing protein